jgi:hypothetical protein
MRKSGYVTEYTFDVLEVGENKCQDLLNILESEEGEYISNKVEAYCMFLYNVGTYLEDTLFREKYPDGIILEQDDRMEIIFKDKPEEKIEDRYYRSCKEIIVRTTYKSK